MKDKIPLWKVITCWFLATVCLILLTHWVHEKFVFNENSPFASFVHWESYTPFPFFTFKGPVGAKNHNWYNEIGYRGPVPSREKDDSYRIFILGGSAVANGEPAFSYHLEKLFHKAQFNKVRVFNFGAFSSMVSQDLSRILYEVVDYHPNLIVMYNGYNELTHPFFADPRPGYPFNFMIHEANPILAKSIEDYPFWPLILYRSSILRQFFPGFFYRQFTNIHRLRSEVAYGEEEWKRKIVGSYWQDISKAKKIADAYDSNFLVVLQAVVYGKVNPELNDESFRKNKKDWDQMFRLLKSNPGLPAVPFYDRSGLFDSYREQVFTDHVHIKQEYRPKVAQALFEIITSSTKLVSELEQ